MPDICMCTGKDCSLKETCYRYKATPSMYQSYFCEPPIENNKCKYYWETESYDKEKEQSKEITKR